MKRIDHAELHQQLQSLLRRKAPGAPAADLAGDLAEHFGRFDIFDPEGGTIDGATLPLFPEAAPAGSPPVAGAAPASFARWLLAQHHRDGWIGRLSAALHEDRGFPLDGDVEAVRRRLGELRASGDDYEALEDAELDWLAL